MERGLTTILAFFLIVMTVILVGKFKTMQMDREKSGDVKSDERTKIQAELPWLDKEEDLPIELKRLKARWDLVTDLTVADLEKMTAEELTLVNVALITNLGTIVLEFYPEEAPKHVRNFIKLTNEEYYDDTLFHRVSPDFVIQGGKGSYDVGYTLKVEVSERKHVRTALGMARTQAGLDTASTQFYICLSDQEELDGEYTVFGRVIFGMEVADLIAKVPTGSKERPKEPVYVWKAVVLRPKADE